MQFFLSCLSKMKANSIFYNCSLFYCFLQHFSAIFLSWIYLNSSMTSFLSEILLPFSILNDLKSRAWCAINCTNQIWRFGQPNSSHIYLVVQIACTCLFIWLRDCLQITFVTLNGLCPLSKKNPHPFPPPPVLNGQYQNGYQPKSNVKFMPLLYWQSFISHS